MAWSFADGPSLRIHGDSWKPQSLTFKAGHLQSAPGAQAKVKLHWAATQWWSSQSPVWCGHVSAWHLPLRSREGCECWVLSRAFEGHSETSPECVQARFSLSPHLPGFLPLSAALRYSYLATNMSATDILEKNKWAKSEFDALPLKSHIQFARWQEWECDLMWTVGQVTQREAPPHHQNPHHRVVSQLRTIVVFPCSPPSCGFSLPVSSASLEIPAMHHWKCAT